MKVTEAIVLELDRQGVAEAMANLEFAPAAMARAVVRAADGQAIHLFPNQR
ncbi:hypothetical protein [Bradyrhizobium sp. SZCCHNPS1003]|uniref:hypothetical protein n=1 Tax=Bradyrhizobium sp. SZCCHNPS1003 TaxID=3057330 RepID=UPI0028E20240|nr:hypothetical protein [Bradyrhizobium sp. SZCCHNPS1003]